MQRIGDFRPEIIINQIIDLKNVDMVRKHKSAYRGR